MYLSQLQTVFVTTAKCTLCSEGGSYLMLVAAALASLVEQGEEGGAGGAGSDMEMICHSGAEIISPRSGKSVRNQIQRFVSQQMTQPPNYFISLSDADQDAQKIGKEETSNIYENAQSSRSEIMKS